MAGFLGGSFFDKYGSAGAVFAAGSFYDLLKSVWRPEVAQIK